MPKNFVEKSFAVGRLSGVFFCVSPVAQLVEQTTVNRWVASSSLARGAIPRPVSHTVFSGYLSPHGVPDRRSFLQFFGVKKLSFD